MGRIKSLNDRYVKKKYVDPKVRICVECGSSRLSSYGKYISCKDCGVIRHFRIKATRFYPGECVRILESNSDIIYRIKKIKKSKEGTVLYVLRSLEDNSELLYYEGVNSKMQKVIETKTSSSSSSSSKES